MRKTCENEQKNKKGLDLSEKSLVLRGQEYRLGSAFFHRGGSSSGGHYYSKLEEPDGQGWWHCDDDKVRKEETLPKTSTAVCFLSYKKVSSPLQCDGGTKESIFTEDELQQEECTKVCGAGKVEDGASKLQVETPSLDSSVFKEYIKWCIENSEAERDGVEAVATTAIATAAASSAVTTPPPSPQSSHSTVQWLYETCSHVESLLPLSELVSGVLSAIQENQNDREKLADSLFNLFGAGGIDAIREVMDKSCDILMVTEEELRSFATTVGVTAATSSAVAAPHQEGGSNRRPLRKRRKNIGTPHSSAASAISRDMFCVPCNYAFGEGLKEPQKCPRCQKTWVSCPAAPVCLPPLCLC